MPEANLEIRAVESKADLKTFIQVPWTIYRDDDNWIPPLIAERKQAFSSKNPFFRHARWQAWTAWRNDRPVGRISAQIDKLHLKWNDPETGFFGLIEAIDDPDVFSALFEAAETWLRDNGMTAVIGPFNLGINQELGLLVEGFDTPPYIMMGHALPCYHARITSLGYEKAQDLLAYGLGKEAFALPEKVKHLLIRQRDKMRLRQVDRKQTPAELERMRDVFNDAWSGNWGFVPFTKEEFAVVGKELFTIVPPDFTWIAEVDGAPAAFIVLLPNVNEAIADLDGRLLPFGWLRLLWRLKVRCPKTGRIALMGVRQTYQHTRLGPALAFLLIQALYEPATRRGMQQAEMSWILEQNQAMRNIVKKVGGRVTKRYRIYRKSLA
jgi:GNAT superfamily N-acetyltransferase